MHVRCDTGSWMRADGTDRRTVYSRPGQQLSSPVWSPNGRWLAFARAPAWDDHLDDIYVIRYDGTDLRRVTRTGWSYIRSNDWSSRNRLVLVIGKPVTRFDVFTIRPDGLGRRRLTNNRVHERQLDWAPGGRRLTFVRDDQIWTMRASGTNARTLASGHSPTWAPDGSVIAFVGAADGAIHTVKPSGEDETVIGSPVDDGLVISGLDWQPRRVDLAGRKRPASTW